MSADLQLSTADGGGEGTLVVVFLRGGADTLNFVVPHFSELYYQQRPTLAIDRPGKEGAAIDLDGRFGLHPEMAALEPLFKEGKMAAVVGVGTDNPTGSHFECEDQMEHGDVYGSSVGGGWLGRVLKELGPAGREPLAAVAVGKTIPESLRAAPAAAVLSTLEDFRIGAAQKPEEMAGLVRQLGALYGAEPGLLGDNGKRTLRVLDQVGAAVAASSEVTSGVEYPDDRFGKGLREIARVVKANLGLRVATIDLPGWDSHVFQNAAFGFGRKVGGLADGIAAFMEDTADHKVTVLVHTEFGRRLYENGSLGTDHGRGFTALALGHGIAGGQVVDRLGDDDIGREKDAGKKDGPNGLRIDFDYREVFAEVARGALGDIDMGEVFPSTV